MPNTNNSATGGYLNQKNSFLSDDNLMNAVQEMIVGVLDMTPTLVRPRWQPTPPRQPDPTTDWIAIAIISRTSTDYPHIQHGNNNGPDTLTRWTTLNLLASMYGPNAQRIAEQLRDALYIAQNFEHLNTLGVRMRDAGELTAVPELTNNVWVNRADLPITLVMEAQRTYDIRDILSADVSVHTEAE